ncbi:unnamed protein product [Camellia sinensis]
MLFPNGAVICYRDHSFSDLYGGVVARAFFIAEADMNRTHLCSINSSYQFTRVPKIPGFGFLLQRNERPFERRRLRFVFRAELTKPFSANIGLDSQAFCRIFRAAEQLHNALMDTLCNPSTGECSVSYNFPSEDKPLLEDKIVSVLGCMVCLLNKGKEDVLSGRSSVLSSSRVADVNVMEDKLPPLAVFRGEMKSLNVWRRLQRLKNVCFDFGFPRGDGDPCHALFANWNCVYLSTSKEDIESLDSEVAFWRGSQVTEEGLKWLMENGFKTIVDLRAETIMDKFYETVLDEAILSGKVELVKLPVEVRTAPSMEQVEKFAALVSNLSKKPIYLHSKEGVWRTSAMASRWRQLMVRYASQFVSKYTTTQSDIPSQDGGTMEELSTSNLKGSCFGDENGLLPEKNDMINNSTSDILSHDSPAAENEHHNFTGAYFGVVSHQDTTSMTSANNDDVNPLKSQLPPSNVFSRKEMSIFLRNKISPPTYINYQQRRLETLCAPRENYNEALQRSEIIVSNPDLRLMEAGNSNGSAMVASFLYHQEKMNVVVEPDVHDIFARIPGFGFVQTFYSQDMSHLHERVDLVACLGGDGVILHASNLFRGAVPPVVSFNLGSLGFLTSHKFEDYRQDLRHVIRGNNTLDGVYITLRMRLCCEIFRNGEAMPGKVFDVLNEVVVDRGSNPYISKIECYDHDCLITKVQGDGVIVATPTGSTAYSTAAGGSMVHPNVPCMLFTPICPHSLSFRPVILPDSARLELKIPEDARSNAWVSFDGKRRQQLSRGDSVRISMSQHPLPTVNKSDQTGDWFHSLIRCLNWNKRLDQKAL